MSVIDTGLGWKCDSDYFVDEADAELAIISTDTAYKALQGAAIAAQITNGNSTQLFLISTVENNAKLKMNSSLRTVYSVSVGGETWYISLSYMSSSVTSDYPLITASKGETLNDTTPENLAKIISEITEAAEVVFAKKIPTVDYIHQYVEGVETETANRVGAIKNMVARVFSATTVYTVDDYCIYNNNLYRCTKEHRGAWSANDFTLIYVTDEIEEMKAKTEKNHLELGQIYAIENGTIKYGFAELFGANIPSITVSADDVPTTGLYKAYQLGDLVAYQTSANSGVTIATIAGRSEGISKGAYGQWIYPETCHKMLAGLTRINYISNLDRSEVKDMSGMYAGNTALDSFSTMDINTPKAINLSQMFSGCTSLQLFAIRISDSVAENLSQMFSGCTSLVELNVMILSNKIKDVSRMFYDCTNLANLNIKYLDLTKATKRDKMFGEAEHWAGITKLDTPYINPYSDIPLPQTLYTQDGTAYTTLPVTTGTSIELRESWT